MSKEKVKKAVVYRWYSQVIARRGNGLGKKFYVVEELGSRRILIEIENGAVQYADPQLVVNELLLYVSNNEVGNAYELTHAEAHECVKFWKAITTPIQVPKYLGEKDDPALCFQRLSFNYSDEPRETLILDDFMSRCTNAEAIKQFIGSLTIENSSRFQYGWIFGTGGEGKGSFGRGLVSIFGTGCVTMAVPKTDGQKQFLAFSLQGKRLCIFPECSNYSFPRDPLFKQLTGGDHVWLEQKGKMGFSAEINCKFLFLSNDRPGVEGSDANLRRMIYSEVAKPTVGYPPGIYDALVRAEMPDFIIKCRNLYLEMCPNDENIKIDDKTTRDLIDINEEQWEVLTDKWFIKDSEDAVTPARMREISRLEHLTTHEHRLWIEYMRARLGVESIVGRWGNKKLLSRKWVGIRDRLPEELADWVLRKGGA